MRTLIRWLRALLWLPLALIDWLFGEDSLTAAEIRAHLRRLENMRPRNEAEINHWRAELAQRETP
jgi:hypothetical protein